MEGHFKAQCVEEYCTRCAVFGHAVETCAAGCRRCGAPHATVDCAERRRYSVVAGMTEDDFPALSSSRGMKEKTASAEVPSETPPRVSLGEKANMAPGSGEEANMAPGSDVDLLTLGAGTAPHVEASSSSLSTGETRTTTTDPEACSSSEEGEMGDPGITKRRVYKKWSEADEEGSMSSETENLVIDENKGGSDKEGGTAKNESDLPAAYTPWSEKEEVSTSPEENDVTMGTPSAESKRGFSASSDGAGSQGKLSLGWKKQRKNQPEKVPPPSKTGGKRNV